ncbi:MAG TPA: hypothetical protein VKT77_14965 [Chthonomonadaceae bacterium]|nr:hypothetical protein [Chthonomonadaceae bacterium]
MTFQGDSRRVALIKSLATNNRFYALVEPERGIKNADAIASIPDDLLLGIAYPCLEDGLNDFAVIRTTFETLDLFPDDDPIRDEMMEIVNDARANLLRRLSELHDKIQSDTAHFLGTDYNEFKDYSVTMIKKGYPRRNLDSMMKLNVFSSVATAEGHNDASDVEYVFEFNYADVHTLLSLPANTFIVELFQEVINSVKDDANYAGKYAFDKNVFQKFIAVMFINYATTDPMFYGINKKDYGVSGDRDMEDTPLYTAIARELREIEARVRGVRHLPVAPPPAVPPLQPAPHESDFGMAAPLPGADSPAAPPVAGRLGGISYEQAGAMLPNELINEEVLLGPLHSLCSAASLLRRKADPETQRFARVILADASKLVQELKRLGIVSPVANDPGLIE